jgi:tRNA-Thr(GGU) m(6)t(6)A37 methyltransferase TsaA
MPDDEDINITPIGYVKNEFEKGPIEGYEKLISEIILNPTYSEGLHLLEENSHIFVVFWMNRIENENRKIMKMHPKGREDLPLVGVFATRSPRRPNPLGIRAVRLLEIKDNTLKVEGLDALNGSPVLDIKPYSSKHDLVTDPKQPWWIKDLNKKGIKSED